MGVCTNDFRRRQWDVAGVRPGRVDIPEAPGYRTEMPPFGGIKDSGNGDMEGGIEAMKCNTSVNILAALDMM